MPGGAVLEVRIDSKDFASAGNRPRRILRDVHFVAQPGEVLALVGPSGIGKSTVLRIVLGLDQDFAGLARMPRGRIGVMFQEPRLLPWLTVAENLRLVCHAKTAQSDVTELLDRALLPPIQTLLPGELSLGMARRVAFARALAVDPSTLILDEPFASLDRQLASSIGSRITERATQCGTLVLLSTHDLQQAMHIADRILVLSGDPATLAVDARIPADSSESAHDRMRRELLTDFPFLGAAADSRLTAP